VSFVEILKTREGKSKGVAVVELVTREGSKACIEALHRKEFGGRTLQAKEIRDPKAFFGKIEQDTGVDFLVRGAGDRRPAPSRERRISPGLPVAYETYGLSMSFLDNLGLRPPLVNRIFVTNVLWLSITVL
jgi:RNA recognition motif-containing protein